MSQHADCQTEGTNARREDLGDVSPGQWAAGAVVDLEFDSLTAEPISISGDSERMREALSTPHHYQLRSFERDLRSK